ncbi:tenascin XB [Pseudohyphozyma bogoriensis]|nr:tenascin XB [Pseudohyphozyma bogoriensis]
MFFTRHSFTLAVFASAAVAQVADLTPRKAGEADLEEEDVEKRGLIGSTLCGIGFNGVCASNNQINTLTDSKNCGTVGNVCPTSYANGGSGYCNNGVCTASSCNSGYAFSTAANGCISTVADSNNCGAVGRVCTVANGKAQCIASQCVPASCNANYKIDGSSCTAINYNTDSSNCGSAGNVCPSSYANGFGSGYCSGGQCTSSCSSGYTFSTAGQACVNTNNDANNCGSVGRVCPSTMGTATCSSGSCAYSSCASGYQYSSGQCTAINYSTNPNYCGTASSYKTCSAGTGGTGVSCVSGKCQVTGCSSGYSISSDGSSCNVINTTSDVNNCGAKGRVCPTSYSNAPAGSTVCVNSVCQPSSCNSGFAYDASISSCRGVTTDPNNCGSVGNKCTVTGGTAGCSNGVCTVQSCYTPYRLVGGTCTTSASARARVKKSKITPPVKLCPGSETACPIVGSASFMLAQASGFEIFRVPDQRGLRAAGGYECLDTQYSIESCGGCASMGEGINCLQVPHSAGVGCSAGACVVFSCEAGYKPNFDSTGCVKAASPARARRQHAQRAHETRHRH